MNYPSLQQRRIVDAATRWMEDVMSRYDTSHDALHVHRVRKTALKLASQLSHRSLDILVVELSAIFHDLLDKKYRSPVQSKKEISTYEFFLPFFRENALYVDLVTSGQAALIAKIIDNVSWSTETELRNAGGLTDWHETCVELHCVQDADRLDAMGAIGIMRCAAFSCAKNRPLALPGDMTNPSSAVGHIYEKLLHIKDRLKTAPGQKMGEARHQLMEGFVRALHEECGD